MTVFKMVFDGTKGYQMQMGKKEDMAADEVKEYQDDKGVIPQLFYLSPDYTLSYLGTEKVAGEDAYKLKVTKPSGKVTLEYYSTKSGLLLKDESSSTQEGQEITTITEYKNYQKAGNLLLPFTITQQAGQMEFNMQVKEAKINDGVTEADFN